jgi:hypothetical protein
MAVWLGAANSSSSSSLTILHGAMVEASATSALGNGGTHLAQCAAAGVGAGLWWMMVGPGVPRRVCCAVLPQVYIISAVCPHVRFGA